MGDERIEEYGKGESRVGGWARENAHQAKRLITYFWVPPTSLSVSYLLGCPARAER